MMRSATNRYDGISEQTYEDRASNTNILSVLNSMNATQLMDINGIGKVLSRRIISHVPFDSVEQLLDVDRIGPSKYDNIVSYLTDLINEETSEDRVLNTDTLDVRTSNTDILSVLNSMNATQLMDINGLGKVLSRRIISCMPFDSVEQLLDVDKIGSSRYNSIISYLTNSLHQTT